MSHCCSTVYSIRTSQVMLLRDLYSIKRDLSYCHHSITPRHVTLLLYSIILFLSFFSFLFLTCRIVTVQQRHVMLLFVITHDVSHIYCYYSISSCHIGMTKKKSCDIAVHQLQRVVRNGRSTNWYFTAREMVKILKCRLYCDFTLSI